MAQETEIRCPYCHSLMPRWANPQMTSWNGEYQYVCFNDNCAYFVRGWEWMMNHYNVTASYRHRLEPGTGECGPLPVWSHDALKSGILFEKAGQDA